MSYRTRLFAVCWGVALLTALPVARAYAQEPDEDTPDEMASMDVDPAAGIQMLTDATANETGASSPFLGLATPIRVDPQFGTATSTIPIALPPGRGLTPKLTVRYSSNAGKGLFGLGWDLSIGCIKRNSAVGGVPLDYFAAPNNYSDASGFLLVATGGGIVTLDTCKDGSSPCTSWAASSEEVWLDASFDRVNDVWYVTDSNGVVFTYGDFSQVASLPRVGSNPFTPETTFAWLLNNVRDPNGNEVSIEYESEGDVEPVPYEIHCGGNPAVGIPHTTHIAFTYQATGDSSVSYRNGLPETRSSLIDAISVYVDGFSTFADPTRKYSFQYSETPLTTIQRLVTVSETVAVGSPPPPTTFSYSAGPSGVTAAAPLSFGATPLLLSNGLSVQGLRELRDVNGDSLVDIVDLTQDYADSVPGADLFFNVGPYFADLSGWNSTITHSPSPPLHPNLADLDGDGLPDFFDADSCWITGSGGCTPTPCSWNFFRNDGFLLETASTPWPGVPPDLLGSLPPPNPSYSRCSKQPTTQLVDLNNDGRPDILDCGGKPCVSGTYVMPGCIAQCSVFLNTGSGFSLSGALNWSVPASNTTYTTPTVLLASQGGYDTSVLEAFFGYHTTWVYIAIIDINGDGRPDLVNTLNHLSDPGSWDVYLNTGSGFASTPMTWAVPTTPNAVNGGYVSVPLSGIIPVANSPKGYAVTRGLHDMNGDGLPDYVDATTSPWTVYLNNGSGFSSGVPWVGTSGPLTNAATESVKGASQSVVTSDVVDINGDGIADIVQASSTPGQYLQSQLGNGQGANLLISEDSGTGASYDVTYASLAAPGTMGSGCVSGTNDGAPCLNQLDCPGGGECAAGCLNCSKLPFPSWVVQTLTKHSGLAGTGHDLTTEFTFSGAFFDKPRHQFRGFQQSVERRVGDPDTRTIRRQYAPPPLGPCSSAAPPWCGAYSTTSVPSRPFKLVDKQLGGDGNIFSETTIQWQTTDVGGGRVQVHPSRRTETLYSDFNAAEPSFVRTHTYDLYDACNNLESDTVSGSGLTPIQTTTTYWAGTHPGTVCRARPATRVVTSAGVNVKDNQYTYNTTCNLLTVASHLASSGQSVTGSGATLITTTTLTYDGSQAGQAGQPTTVADALNHATTLSYSCSNGTVSYTGLRPCSATNDFGQSTKTFYDLQWGKPTTTTDSNGNTTRSTYDGRGRLTSILRPADALSWRQFAYTDGSTGVPTRVDMYLREPNDTSTKAPDGNVGYHLMSRFYDGFGRPLETKQAEKVQSALHVVATDAVAFDAAGRVAELYAPFTAGGIANLTTYDSPSGASASLSYDALDEQTRWTHPDGSFRTSDHLSAPGWLITSDENYNECAQPTGKQASCPGQQVREQHDALGRAIHEERYQGATLVTETDRQYDALGHELREDVLAADYPVASTTTFQYDSFGRQTLRSDPSTGSATAPGQWAYAYDAAGHLTYQDDPTTGQHLQFCYDQLGRLSLRYTLPWDSASAIKCTPTATGYPYIRYQYEPTSSRLTDVLSAWPSGDTIETGYSYDNRNQVSEETLTRSLVVNGVGHTGSYTIHFGHDLSDRLEGVSYPTNGGNETLMYDFGQTGQLQAAGTKFQTYADSVAYDAFGRMTQWVTGAGTVDSTTFGDASMNFRLAGRKVTTLGNVVQQFDYPSYGYDVAGNLLILGDYTLAYASTSALNNTWHYTFDGLGRLQTAKPATGVTTPFTYDGLDNMTSGNQDTHQFTNEAHPNQLTAFVDATGSHATTYDPDGGFASISTGATVPRRTLTYDPDARVQTVATSDGHTVRSVYDYQGSRVARIVDEGLGSETITFYYGRWFDVTGTTVTRHIYLGNQLIADSPAADASSLLLSSALDAVPATMFVRTTGERVGGDFSSRLLFLHEGGDAPFGALLLGLSLGLMLARGRARVGLLGSISRRSVWLVLVVYAAGLMPGSLPRRAAGQCFLPPPLLPVYFRHTDQVGSTTLLTCYGQSTCADGAVAQYYRYDAYGNARAYNAAGTLQASVNALTEHLYTGQVWDAAAHLYYDNARFYDPMLAMFVSPDPLRTSRNPYAYVSWNPIGRIDPTGLQDDGGDDDGGDDDGGDDDGGDDNGGGDDLGVGNGVPLGLPAGTDGDDSVSNLSGDLSTSPYLQQSIQPFADLGNSFQTDPLGTLNTLGIGLAAAGISIEDPGQDPNEVESAIESGESAIEGALSGGGAAVSGVPESPLSTGLSDAAENTVQVIHFTDAAGVQDITDSGALRAGTYVTVPGEVNGLTPSEVEPALEIQPGRGAFSTTFEIPPSQLVVPETGPLTSGGIIQFQLTEPAIPGPFIRTPQGW